MPTTQDIAILWKSGRQGKSGGSFSTDGADIYSYALKIGYTDDQGNKVAIDYTGKHRYSATTSKHVSYAKRVADKVVQPD